MAHAPLITDAELLSMGIATDALSGVASGDRDQARDAASALVLSYVAKRHTLPLVSWGDDLRRVVAHVASYDLLALRGYAPQAGADALIRTRYEDALAWLERVADGRCELIDLVDSTPETDEQAPLVSSAGPPLWPDYGTRYR